MNIDEEEEGSGEGEGATVTTVAGEGEPLFRFFAVGGIELCADRCVLSRLSVQDLPPSLRGHFICRALARADINSLLHIYALLHLRGSARHVFV